jgi:hypothetical protein
MTLEYADPTWPGDFSCPRCGQQHVFDEDRFSAFHDHLMKCAECDGVMMVKCVHKTDYIVRKV